MTLPQTDTVQLPCSRLHFNRAPLDRTDRETQTRGTRAYSPFICSLRRTVAADINLPMEAVTIDVTPVKVALRFRLATIATYRSSTGDVTFGKPPRAFGQLTVWFGIVSINVKLQNVERRRKEQHLRSTVLLQCASQHASAQNLPFVFWKSLKHREQLFGYIGGLMGCWLGISIMVSVDIFERIWYYVRLKWQFRSKSKRSLPTRQTVDQPVANCLEEGVWSFTVMRSRFRSSHANATFRRPLPVFQVVRCSSVPFFRTRITVEIFRWAQAPIAR
ncbi:uncharacterized protein TNCV_2231101 [Trichonephila clavipes]|nr:uncharacterized protein TNCV_2231101 [Trichonephila clavipes]